jgi:predicted nuclease of predicted toxin-antitoxin system
MRVLLDQGLPRSAAGLLCDLGIDAIHTGQCGLATATDAEILDFARQQGRVVFTLDADFHTLLVMAGAAAPSVVRIRIEGLRAEQIARLVHIVIQRCREELEQGAMVSVTEKRIRVRGLPVR